MKVFITVELEEKDITDSTKGMTDATYNKLQKFIQSAREDGIGVQYKETNLPRFKKASEM